MKKSIKLKWRKNSDKRLRLNIRKRWKQNRKPRLKLLLKLKKKQRKKSRRNRNRDWLPLKKQRSRPLKRQKS